MLAAPREMSPLCRSVAAYVPGGSWERETSMRERLGESWMRRMRPWIGDEDEGEDEELALRLGEGDCSRIVTAAAKIFKNLARDFIWAF